MDGWRWVLGRDWVAKVREPDNHRAPSLPLQADQQGVSAVHVVVVLTDSPPGEDKETGELSPLGAVPKATVLIWDPGGYRDRLLRSCPWSVVLT